METSNIEYEAETGDDAETCQTSKQVDLTKPDVDEYEEGEDGRNEIDGYRHSSTGLLGS